MDNYLKYNSNIYRQMGLRSYGWFLLKAFLMSFGWYFTILPPCFLIASIVYLSKKLSLPISLTIPISLAVIQIFVFLYFLKDQIEEYFNKILSEFNESLRLFKKEKEEQEKNAKLEYEKINREKEKLRTLLSTHQPFKTVAAMKTDVEMIVFQEGYRYLKYKKRPAIKAAEEVRKYKKISDSILRDSLEIKYKYEYILEAFPEIAEYVDNDEDLIAVGERLSYKDLEETKDGRKDYLSSEEYRSLSEAEKSQLALDRYVKGINKSRWQIGRDYEMSCAFQLKELGYMVDMTGIKYRKQDLGRDLIAIKNRGGLFEILIVQCKNWSKDRIIHENVIMQLFGTTVLFQVSNPVGDDMVVPVLAIPPYSQLSDVALKVARQLKIRIERLQYIDFPRIKCNINDGNKIYHLPFDQQYDRTEIRLAGEFYAYTVKEAEDKGFRRAMKHMFN